MSVGDKYDGDKKGARQPLIDEKEALSAYFDALLQGEPRSATAKPVTPKPAYADPVVVPLTLIPTLAPRLKPPQPAVAVAVEPAVKVVVRSDAKPSWGEGSFQAMLFKVSGLTLAVPLVELNGVQEWRSSPLTPMPGHVVWYLGLTTYRDHSVPVIDTARFVLPANRQFKLDGVEAADRLNRIVFIGDGQWGLACDEVQEVITLTPEQVKWRSQGSSRPWLAGTVIERMCALIDPQAFAAMLASGLSENETASTHKHR